MQFRILILRFGYKVIYAKSIDNHLVDKILAIVQILFPRKLFTTYILKPYSDSIQT